jgi:hypothetical protein
MGVLRNRQASGDGDSTGSTELKDLSDQVPDVSGTLTEAEALLAEHEQAKLQKPKRRERSCGCW